MIMKIIMVLAICVLTGSDANSDLLRDANEIMRLLKITVNRMEPLSHCFAQTNVTIEEKRRCLAILTELRKPGKNRSKSSQRTGRQPNRTWSSGRPGHSRILRDTCRPFHRWAC